MRHKSPWVNGSQMTFFAYSVYPGPIRTRGMNYTVQLENAAIQNHMLKLLSHPFWHIVELGVANTADN